MATIRPLISTYRLQLHPHFGFDAAAGIADYLHALGISHVYTSPYLQAAPGSTHGYDIVDHDRVNRELGGDAGRARFVEQLDVLGLGHVVDVVPNHMSISTIENRWWAEVLENGPSSRYSAYFDVDWDAPEARLRNVVLVPILADHYGRVLERRELSLERQGGTFKVRYGDHRYPVSVSSLGPLLARAARICQSDALAFIADALNEMPRPTVTDRASVRRRHRDREVLRAELDRHLQPGSTCTAVVDGLIAELNESPDALHDLLEAQSYRLAWWRRAGRDLGYRRFFDVNTLAGLRVEDEQVFEDTHRRVLSWIADGTATGLRVDHPDGLRDPQQYFDRLREAAPDAWIVAEKILMPGETLPGSWPVAGTTGYDFLNEVGGLFVDSSAEGALTALYQDFTGQSADFKATARARKLHVLREVLGSDVNYLTHLLVAICERHRRHRDYSRHELTDAVRELIASLDVYRTYIRPVPGSVEAIDRDRIREAASASREARPDLDPELFDLLHDLLVLDIGGDLEHEFVWRFQQLCSSAMAKGVEDTAFYNDSRFIALNEVGGDPSRFGRSPEAFHASMSARLAAHPESMLATTTHDTKRAEDVRARLAVLSEIPDGWGAAVRRWSAAAETYRTREWPDRGAEYLFFQTLVGAWPLSKDRALAYMEKAIREARQHTSWITPVETYEQAVRRFVSGVLDDEALVADIETFVERILEPGRINSLAQTLIKVTAPGIPDIYQGSELWDLRLVDPDNRTPVDYEERRRALARTGRETPAELWRTSADGAAKMAVIREALALRRRRPDLFSNGAAYAPIYATGTRAEHVVAFQRAGQLVTVVQRLPLRAGGKWEDTSIAIPVGTWINRFDRQRFTGSVIPVGALFHDFPVALLELHEPSGT